MMREQLPEYELALTGWDRVLAFLHDLGVRCPNGHTLTRRIVQRWARTNGFPLVRGTWNPRSRTPCLTTSFAVTAWMLTRADTRSLFPVYDPAQSVSAKPYRCEGSTPAPLDTRRLSSLLAAAWVDRGRFGPLPGAQESACPFMQEIADQV